MLSAIKYQFTHLTEFSGRDARQTFWYWVLFLVVVQFVIAMVLAAPLYFDMFTSALNAARSGASEEEINAAMFANMGDQLRRQMLVSLVTGLITSALFAASFVRRLHDSGKPGWILALALVPYLGALLYNYANFDSMMALVESSMATGDPDSMMINQSQLYAYSAFGWIGYIVVIVFGVMKSDDGPNRYGAEPVRF